MAKTISDLMMEKKDRLNDLFDALKSKTNEPCDSDIGHVIGVQLGLLEDIDGMLDYYSIEDRRVVADFLQKDVKEYNDLAKKGVTGWSVMDLGIRIDLMNDLLILSANNPGETPRSRVFHGDCGKCSGKAYFPSAGGRNVMFSTTTYECQNPECAKATFGIDDFNREYYFGMNKLNRMVE